MLDLLKDKLIATLTAEALKNTYGNRAAIEQERRSFYAEVVGRLFPALQDAVRAEVDVVRQQLASAEQAATVADANCKLAADQIVAASAALEAACKHSNDAATAADRAETALASARAEFAALLEKSRG